MAKKKLFGTDGIRGLVNEEPMTAQTILQVGQALGCVIQTNRLFKGRPKVVIGKDTRLSGYTFETALQAGLCSMGIDVLLIGPVPTPAVAFVADNMRAEAGIMITASHNPFFDNGIKIFTSKGFKLDSSYEKQIQEMVYHGFDFEKYLPSAKEVGRAKRVEDAPGRYISSVKQHFLHDTTLDGVKIVLDCAHGASYKVAPLIFEELGADVVKVGCQPDGLNINEGVGALYPENLVAKVKTENADLGIAFDGDGDRVMAVDKNGKVYDGDDFLSILMEDASLQPDLHRGIVGTLMTNYGVESKCERQNIPFYRADVGDRHVVELLKKKRCVLGGEPSGHLVYLSKSTTGDGLLSAILLLNVLIGNNKNLDAFSDSFERYPQALTSIKVKEKKPIDELPKIVKAIEYANKKLKGNGRTLTRYSGTENKIRVMVESSNKDLMDQVMADLCEAVEKELGVSAA
ncbi:MAG: phosphoglucosamine mutase [Deltaproteobacteria bacterium]|nr:phosphoglucosamine mutase [Deltaproteobacteria bacterium]